MCWRREVTLRALPGFRFKGAGLSLLLQLLFTKVFLYADGPSARSNVKDVRENSPPSPDCWSTTFDSFGNHSVLICASLKNKNDVLLISADLHGYALHSRTRPWNSMHVHQCLYLCPFLSIIEHCGFLAAVGSPLAARRLNARHPPSTLLPPPPSPVVAATIHLAAAAAVAVSCLSPLPYRFVSYWYSSNRQ